MMFFIGILVVLLTIYALIVVEDKLNEGDK
jgi:hypothetical protein